MATKPNYPDARPNAFGIGIEFQDYVCILLAQDHIILQNLGSKLYQLQTGENLQGFEIKYDGRCTDTGRLSIEVAEKSCDNPDLDWTPSGILRDDNSWLYIQGNHDVIYIFAKNWLLRYFREKHPEVQAFNGTIRRFFLPFPIADLMAAKVLRPQSISANSQDPGRNK